MTEISAPIPLSFLAFMQYIFGIPDNKKSPEIRRLLLLSENIKILFLLLVGHSIVYRVQN